MFLVRVLNETHTSRCTLCYVKREPFAYGGRALLGDFYVGWDFGLKGLLVGGGITFSFNRFLLTRNCSINYFLTQLSYIYSLFA